MVRPLERGAYFLYKKNPALTGFFLLLLLRNNIAKYSLLHKKKAPNMMPHYFKKLFLLFPYNTLFM